MEGEMRMGGTLGEPLLENTAADRLASRSGQAPTLVKHARPFETFISGVLFFCGAASILTTIGIVLVLGTESLRFFANTAWINTGKSLVETVDAEATIISLSEAGTPLEEDYVLRIGETDPEYMRIIRVIDPATVEVERGINGSQAIPHEPNSIFRSEEVSLFRFLTEPRWSPRIGQFGIRPLVASTLMTSFIAMLVATPLGLAAAIYLSEYANRRVRGVLKPILEILAGVPTVVYGYFALTFITPLLRSDFSLSILSIFNVQEVQIYNVASAGIVVGILIIPTIATIAEDAINAVPNALRQASMGLGATRQETVFKVLLPSAISGIAAGLILGLSRAVGETMIVLIAAGAAPNPSVRPFEFGETMAGHIARISTGDLSFNSIDYNSVFAVGMTLFVITLILNMISSLVVRRFREVYS